MAVQQLEMALGAEQRLMLVLAVNLHQPLAHPGERLHRGYLAVDVGARAAAVGGKRAADNQFALAGFGELLSALRSGASPSSSNMPSTTASFCPARIMSGEARLPSSRPSAVMMMVLAGAGLAREHVEAGAEVQRRAFDDGEIADA